MQEKSMHNKRVGRTGEDIACDYLNKNGFVVIGRNVSYKAGEIDIIAKRGKELHFIEVKSRLSAYIDPVHVVTQKKQKKIKVAAKLYLRNPRNNFKDGDLPACYFDVIGVDLSDTTPNIEFIVDAFY